MKGGDNIVSKEFLYSQLYDHYKETVMYLKDDLSKRERITIVSLIVVTGYFLIEFKTLDSVVVANQWIEKNWNLSLNINYNILSIAILILILGSIMRYFQICVNIEKQYAYIHQVEAKLNELTQNTMITRESYSYLNDYPLLSALIHRLYNFFFPVLLIISMFYKIYKIVFNFEGVISILNILIVILIILCTFLYILYTYRDVEFIQKINDYTKRIFIRIHLYKEDI